MKKLIKNVMSFALLTLIGTSIYASHQHTGANTHWIQGVLKYEGLEAPTWVIVYSNKVTKKDESLLLFNSKGQLFVPPKNYHDGNRVTIDGYSEKSPEISIYGGRDRYVVKEIKHVVIKKLERDSRY